jgi:hypothetical protein
LILIQKNIFPLRIHFFGTESEAIEFGLGGAFSILSKNIIGSEKLLSFCL